jgi:hypothetical protein
MLIIAHPLFTRRVELIPGSYSMMAGEQEVSNGSACVQAYISIQSNPADNRVESFAPAPHRRRTHLADPTHNTNTTTILSSKTFTNFINVPKLRDSIELQSNFGSIV